MQQEMKEEKIKEPNVIHHLKELYPRINRYTQFLTQSNWDSEDLTQEAFLKLWTHYRFTPNVSFSLLSKMAYNKWIDTVRKNKKETVVSAPDDELNNETDKMLTRIEVIELITSILTPKQAVILTLKEAFQYQISEIAEILHTTEESVKATLYRAKQKVGRNLTQDAIPNPGLYWEQSEREYLTSIFYHCFLEQDPTHLINAIPYLPSLRKQKQCPKRVRTDQSLKSSTVYLVA